MVRVLLAIALAAGAPVVHHTSAGTTAARASLLKAADLGKGWTSATATTQRGVSLSCRGHAPSAAGIVTRDARGFRFFSSERLFDSLEGRQFRSAREAERAARAVFSERGRRAN